MQMSRTIFSVLDSFVALSIVLIVVFCSFGLAGHPRDTLPDPTELRAKNHMLSLTLHPGITPEGKDSFYLNGPPVAPTLRVSPGDQLNINYINDLTAKTTESCAITP